MIHAARPAFGAAPVNNPKFAVPTLRSNRPTPRDTA